MKILFICGCLEPGKDGVGDYTRRLSEKLLERGHHVALIALHDKYVQEVASIDNISNSHLNVIRIPFATNAEKRTALIQQKIKALDPQWISLQYVPFSFHPKGIPGNLPGLMKKWCAGRKVHIMFHELWIGMDIESSFKHRLIGVLQRQIAKKLIKKVKPASVHTSIHLYQAKLAKLGAKAEVLSLFGNIPVSDNGAVSKDNGISLVIFGGIHYGAPIESLAKEMAIYSAQHNIRVSLSFIGRCGEEQNNWVAAWKTEGLPVQIYGEQSEKQISQLLNDATAGIATTPIALIGKSGSVAAMREHGLPVMCVARKWQVRDQRHIDIPEGVIEYRKGKVSDLFAAVGQTKASGGIDSIVDQLLNKML